MILTAELFEFVRAFLLKMEFYSYYKAQEKLTVMFYVERIEGKRIGTQIFGKEG